MMSLKQLYETGVTLSNIGNYTDAIEYYDKALKLDAKSKETWNAKGTALTNQNNYSEAMKCFDMAISLDSNYTTPWNSKAIAYKNQEKYDDAIKCHEKALAINPKNETALNGIKKIRELQINLNKHSNNSQGMFSPYPIEKDNTLMKSDVKSPYPEEKPSPTQTLFK